MIIRNFIEKEKYYDSVFLMRLAGKISTMEGVSNISAGMGTPLNKDTMHELGLLLPEGEAASPNDLIIALKADNDDVAERVRAAFLELLTVQEIPKGERKYRSLDSMYRSKKDCNLAVVSLAGRYAAAEAMKALTMGMNVFMFSDNVPLEEEIELKKYARDHGLLMMGPDCGLSFIGGVAVGLCSKVRRGTIGISAASGSGMQEVMNIIHKLGDGISHAIGVGGRDLHAEVGGVTMLQSIDLLEEDPDTTVIVLISKPPARETAKKIFARVCKCQKPVVVQFINSNDALAKEVGAYVSDSFENTARMAIALANGETYIPKSKEEKFECLLPMAKQEAVKMAKSQKYLRGLYCGGSLAEETLTIAYDRIGPIYSNIAFSDEYMLKDPFQSKGDCVVDVGAETFTVGKPHVAIDPSPRIDRFVQEARDPETAVVLMDILLGYALCQDPAGMMKRVIMEEKARAEVEGRHLTVISSICGSDLDPQDMTIQEQILKEAGVLVMSNNGEASRLASLIIQLRREMLT